jgi:hypothetical protein
MEHMAAIMKLGNQQLDFSQHLLVITSSKQQIMLGESNSLAILVAYLRWVNQLNLIVFALNLSLLC